MRPLSLVAFRGWHWLRDPEGRPNGLRSPRGTLFECRRVDGGWLARRRADFALRD